MTSTSTQVSTAPAQAQAIQPVRGMNDMVPADAAAWQRLESIARELFTAYAYQEIRVPIVEHTGLFKRSIGEFTDIVQKEMFTFCTISVKGRPASSAQ